MKKNPVRTMVTIIGIIISTAMFTAVTTLTISLYSFVYRTEIYDSGSWHVGFEYKGYDEYAGWTQSGKAEKLAAARVLGYAQSGSENEDKPYIYLESVEDNFYDIMPVHITYGRQPENSGEILLPNHLQSNGNVRYSIGSTVVLELGKRYGVDGDGNPDMEYELSQENPFTDKEILVPDRTCEYTVVGFYDRPSFENYSAPGYTALTCGEPMDDTAAKYSFYVRLQKKYLSEVWSMGEDTGDGGITNYNNTVISIEGSIMYENVAALFTLLVVIFVAIIIVGSVSMIYSAFSISVGERTKQFGLLSSVGATRKQLRHMVFGEAAMVSLIGIPAGVVCGIIGIGITLHFVGNKFNYILTSPYSVNLVINVYAIFAAVAISLITVAVSAVIPAARATRVSAIDAIRQHKDIKIPRSRWHAGRKYRITQKLFGMPGMLARRYFSRSRKKYRVTIFSLSMSITLFIVTSSFCSYLKGYVGDNISVGNYDLRYTVNEEDTAKLDGRLEAILSADGVLDASYCSWNYNYSIISDKEDISDRYLRYRAENGGLIDDEDLEVEAGTYHTGSSGGFVENVMALFIDDEQYGKCLDELGITDDEFKDYENAPVILKNTVNTVEYQYDSESGKYRRYNANYDLVNENVKIITVKCAEDEEPIQIPVGKIVGELPYTFESFGYQIVLLFPYSSKYNAMGQRAGTQYFFITQDGDVHDKMVASVKEKLTEAGYNASDYSFYDPYEYINQRKNLLVLINVFSYGFITLMALICVANVFNTISTNISLRRRDFAMLRSVGLPYSGIKKMMVFECLLYGIRSIIFAAPASIVLSYLIYEVYGGSGEFSFGFFIPWYAIVIAVAGVFVVVGISMAYSVTKVKEDNLIDELKNEND